MTPGTQVGSGWERNNQVIRVGQFRKILMQKFGVDPVVAVRTAEAVDADHDGHIEFTDFL